jgi:hypothetical protein
MLGPLIVRALPLDALDGFHLLTIGSLALTALLTWAAARQLVGQQRALLAIPLLLGTWVAAPNLREFALVDPLAWVFVAAIWLAILRQRWFVAAVLGAIGVLAKEVVLLTAFAAAVAAWTAGRRVGAAIILGLPLLVLAALSVIFRGSGTDVVGYSTAWIRDGLGSLGPLRIVYLMFVSYAAVWLLVPFGFQQLPQPARRAAAVLLVGVVGLPLVGSPERMEEAIFPAVVAAAVLALHRWPYSLAWTLAIGNLVFVARIGGDARIPTALAWAGLLLAVSLAVMPPVLARAQTLRGTTVPSP